VLDGLAAATNFRSPRIGLPSYCESVSWQIGSEDARTEAANSLGAGSAEPRIGARGKFLEQARGLRHK